MRERRRVASEDKRRVSEIERNTQRELGRGR